MASGAADLIDLQQNRVVVAVDESISYFLEVARLLAFEPKPLAGTAVIVRFAGLLGLLPRLFVHISNHQHVARFIVLHDHGNQAVSLGEVYLFHRFSLEFIEVTYAPADFNETSGGLGIINRITSRRGNFEYRNRLDLLLAEHPPVNPFRPREIRSDFDNLTRRDDNAERDVVFGHGQVFVEDLQRMN